MNLDPTFVNSLIMIILAFGGAFLAALWLALVFWTWRDIRSRARDPFSQVLAALVVAVLTLPGILIYLILRPTHTLDEDYQRSLEEEALLAAIEDQSLCPGCERRVREDWQVCPNCHTKLKKSCQQCGKLMELPWNICPYCGMITPGMKATSATAPETETKAEEENESSQDTSPAEIVENNLDDQEGSLS